MEGWRDGGMEGWRDGGMEGWRDGGVRKREGKARRGGETRGGVHIACAVRLVIVIACDGVGGLLITNIIKPDT